MTKGEEIIGRHNPEGNPNIEEIKAIAIELINIIEEKGGDGRRKAIAYTQIELGVMSAVKSLF